MHAFCRSAGCIGGTTAACDDLSHDGGLFLESEQVFIIKKKADLVVLAALKLEFGCDADDDN